jgi:coniferyl-aldehyde dehydrogenase
MDHVITKMRDCFTRQREAFQADMNPSHRERVRRLDLLLRLVSTHEAALVEAISADFGHRSSHETRLLELLLTRFEIRHVRRHLSRWMRPRRLPTAFRFRPAHNRLLRQPLGVVGVIAPWNFPLLLSLVPAVSAIAAGNRVMIKPSELTPRFAALLKTLLEAALGEDLIAVASGGVAIAKEFARLPFDHLLFTGSTQVGRLVALEAASNLTPVTLELGGKSPVIIDAGAPIVRAAGAIAFAKLLNAGQACVAPDYVLVPGHLEAELVEALQRHVRAMYPSVADNPDYTSIVSEQHFDRLRALVDDAMDKGARIVRLADGDTVAFAAGRKFPPTLVLGATDAMRVMQEEIFGPILPILPYARLDEAIAYVNDRDRPLALYWFGADGRARERVLRGTISGGVTVNDCLWHVAQPDAPFGGVGMSGMGAHKGEWGFRTFSKEKPVFHQTRLSPIPLLRPPYGRLFDRLVGLIGYLA